MEITSLTHSEWVRLSEVVIHLWIFAAVLIVTGGSYILAHGFVPSLVFSGDIEESAATKLRLPLYGVAIVSFIATVTIGIKGLLLALDILPEVFPRMLI